MGKYEGFIKFQEYTRDLESEVARLESEKNKLLNENHNLKLQFYMKRSCCGCKYEYRRKMEAPCVQCGRARSDLYEEDV